MSSSMGHSSSLLPELSNLCNLVRPWCRQQTADCNRVVFCYALGVVQNCHHVHESTQRMLLGRGSSVTVCFLKNVIMVHCDFETSSQNRNEPFSKYIFGIE